MKINKPQKSIKDGMEPIVRKMWHDSIVGILEEVKKNPPPDINKWAVKVCDDNGLNYILSLVEGVYIVAAKMDVVDATTRKPLPNEKDGVVITFKFKNPEELI